MRRRVTAVWPGRRYWLWSLRIWGILAAGFVVLTVADGKPDDLIVIFWSIPYWLLLCTVVAVVVFASRVIISRRPQRHI
jgi:hypothetical protein